MRHKFLVLTVKKLLKSVYIYGSYRKIKTGLSLFLDHSVITNTTEEIQFVSHTVVTVLKGIQCFGHLTVVGNS